MIEEFYLMSGKLGTSYDDFYKMPTYVRKYLINRIIENSTPKS